MLQRTLKQPSYLPRRLYWEFLRNVPERILQRRTTHGKMAFSSRDEAIGKYLYLQGQFDWDSTQKAISLLQKLGHLKPAQNALLLDVGANIGTVCIPLVLQNVFTKAWAIEPAPTNLTLLRKNIEMNDLSERLTVKPVALSSVNGTTELFLCEGNPGDHRLAAEGKDGVLMSGEETRPAVTVEMKKLDDVFNEAGLSGANVSLAWIDIQGHEPSMIAGATELLKHHVPLVMEFWPDRLRQHSKAVLDEFFASLEAHYTSYFDLRESHPTSTPLSELKKLMAGEHGPTGSFFTDLVIV